MNHTSYTGTLRNNLCCALTGQKENKARMDGLNETIEKIDLITLPELQYDTDLIINELHGSVRFLEELNSIYGKEVSRLITILLEKTQTEI